MAAGTDCREGICCYILPVWVRYVCSVGPMVGCLRRRHAAKLATVARTLEHLRSRSFVISSVRIRRHPLPLIACRIVSYSCHAMPSHAVPSHAPPCQAEPCHAPPSPDLHAKPRPALPRRAAPRRTEPNHAWTCRALPCLAGPMPCRVIHAMPKRAMHCQAIPRRAKPYRDIQALPCRAPPRLPCHTTPHLAGPCYPCLAKPSRTQHSRAGPCHAMTSHAMRHETDYTLSKYYVQKMGGGGE